VDVWDCSWFPCYWPRRRTHVRQHLEIEVTLDDYERLAAGLRLAAAADPEDPACGTLCVRLAALAEATFAVMLPAWKRDPGPRVEGSK